MTGLDANVLDHVFFTEHKYIVDICRPLKNLGIEGFIFARHYNDGTFIDLGTHKPWGQFFFDRYFSGAYSTSDLQENMYCPENISLSSCNQGNKVWQEAAQYFDLGNGITLHRKFRHYFEIYCFYSTSKNQTINQFYLSHVDVLKKFILYFKDKAKNSIQKGKANRLVSPDYYTYDQHPKTSVEKKLKHFLGVIAPQQENGNKRLPDLSNRELACVRLCAKGMTSHEIGEELYLSRRTIEKHIDNAKKKLSCRTLCELVITVSNIYGLEV